MLHIVSTSSAFEKCLKFVQPKDEILFLEANKLRLYVNPENLQFNQTIDYNQFVLLIIKHNKSITWQ